MLDKLIYISSTNREIHFGEGNILINTNTLRDYEWKYQQMYKRISSFDKDVVSKQLPVLLWGENVKSIANEIFEIIEYDVLNKQYGKLYSGNYYMSGYFVASAKPSYTADGFMKLTLTFATDKPYWVKETTYQYRVQEESLSPLETYLEFEDDSGTLNSYLNYVTSAEDESITISGQVTYQAPRVVAIPLSCTLDAGKYSFTGYQGNGFYLVACTGDAFYVDRVLKPVFTIEEDDTEITLYLVITTSISPSNPLIINATLTPQISTYRSIGEDSYPYDYPYDFLANTVNTDIVNPSFAEQDVKIVIYGKENSIENPVVMIDDHPYSVFVTVNENEHVTINTAEKTITLTKQNGTVENIFNSRNREYYIFQKISSGNHIMSISPQTDVDLVVIEKRSEPVWQ